MTTYLSADALILAVDEFLVMWSLRDALERLGFRFVHTAANVDAGLALIDSHAFRFALLDVNLGHQDSFPIAEALEERGIPFAFVTGYGRSGLMGGSPMCR